jgi:hypothetical protein
MPARTSRASETEALRVRWRLVEPLAILAPFVVLLFGAGWYARRRAGRETALAGILHVLAVAALVLILLRLLGSL